MHTLLYQNYLIENKPVPHTAVEDIVLDVLGVPVAENIIIILFFIIVEV